MSSSMLERCRQGMTRITVQQKKKKNGPKLVENEECRRDLAKLDEGRVIIYQ